MKQRHLLRLGALAVLALASCQSIEAPPEVRTHTRFLSQYVWRGVPQIAHPVLQGDMTVRMKTPTGEALDVGAWGVMPLTRDGGDGALNENRSSTQAGKLNESRFSAVGSTSISGLDLGLGIMTYDFPNLGVRGSSTTELLAFSRWTMWGARPSINLFLDVDEVEGAYVDVRVDKETQHTRAFASTVTVNVAYTEGMHAGAVYGNERSGVADVGIGVSFDWALSTRTTLEGGLQYTTIPDDDLANTLAIRGNGIESDNLVVMLGIAWGY